MDKYELAIIEGYKAEAKGKNFLVITGVDWEIDIILTEFDRDWEMLKLPEFYKMERINDGEYPKFMAVLERRNHE